MKSFISRVLEIYKPFWKASLILFGLIIISQIISLVHPYIAGKVIDIIVDPGSVFNDVILLSILALFFYIVHNSILSYLREKYQIDNLEYDARRHLLGISMEKMMSFSMGQHRNENSGVKNSVITRGQNQLAILVNRVVYNTIPIIIRIVLTIIALFFLSIPMGFVVLLGVSVYIFCSILLNIKISGRVKKIDNMYNQHSKFRSEILKNIEVVQVNAQEKRITDECDTSYGKICQFGKQLWGKYILIMAGSGLMISFTRFAILIIGAYSVFQRIYSPGHLVIFLGWSEGIFGSMYSIGNMQRQLVKAYASVKKYFTMLDVVPEVKTIETPVRPEKFNGRIEFKNVSFKYPSRVYLEDEDDFKPSKRGDLEAISDVDFVIESGQKVAFVGHSGAGKTTIIQLLLRAYDPNQGQIIIDNHDLKVLDLKYFRENIGTVEQDVTLFDETLRYNIPFGLNGGRYDVTDNDLEKISEFSCINKFYDRLEDGFDTVIGEKGIKLSGGERQRVGIARALIKNPRILILDEATSHLDGENEESIHQAIDHASKGRTTIIIAHRLSTVKNADKIFVMDKGKIVGEGSHDELMSSCETYKNLVTKQLVTI